MRNISFMLTTDQVRARSKTVTRRLGWRHAKPGDLLRGVVKSQGLKPGEKIQPLAVVRLTSVRREPLDAIDQADVIAEDFPDLTPFGFVFMFCQHMGCDPTAEVTRLEFEYVEASDPCPS